MKRLVWVSDILQQRKVSNGMLVHRTKLLQSQSFRLSVLKLIYAVIFLNMGYIETSILVALALSWLTST